MRSVLTTAFVLLCLTGVAQERAISGKVVDQEMKGIPFCVVKAKNYNIGTYCDENGQFSVSINTDSVKEVIFSCLGFERKEIPADMLRNSPVTVDLKKSVAALNTVVIKDKKGKPHTETLGRKNVKHVSDCYQRYGDEDAMFLKADTAKDGFLKEVYVYITDEGIPDSKFRIHVYSKDPTTNLPAQELTDSNLIVHAARGNEWVKADLSNKNIVTDGGLYISVEWISGFGNSQRAMQSAKHPEVMGHYGQVMGLTLNYGVKYMYHRNTFKGDTWGFNYTEYLCPMIYGTFVYKK
jgi:hypothetical protein